MKTDGLRRFVIRLFMRLSYWQFALLSVVRYLFADNGCADNRASADEQQDDPQSEIAAVAGLLRCFVTVSVNDFRCQL